MMIFYGYSPYNYPPVPVIRYEDTVACRRDREVKGWKAVRYRERELNRRGGKWSHNKPRRKI